jgi:hypothetical protein
VFHARQGGALASAAQAMNPATAGRYGMESSTTNSTTTTIITISFPTRVSQLVISSKSSYTKTPLAAGVSSLSLCVFADMVVVAFIAQASPLLNSERSITPSSPDFNPLLKVTKRDTSGFNVSSNPLLLANTTVHTQVVDTRPLYTAWTTVQQVKP